MDYIRNIWGQSKNFVMQGDLLSNHINFALLYTAGFFTYKHSPVKDLTYERTEQAVVVREAWEPQPSYCGKLKAGGRVRRPTAFWSPVGIPEGCWTEKCAFSY